MNIRWPVVNSYSSVQSSGIVDFPDMGTSWHSVYERPNIPKVDGWEGQREENIDKHRQASTSIFFFEWEEAASARCVYDEAFSS